jgi:hypothetical protein
MLHGAVDEVTQDMAEQEKEIIQCILCKAA